MKSPVLFVGIVGLVSSTAFAGPLSGRETRSLTKVASLEKLEVAKVDAALPVAASESVSLAVVGDGVPAIPELPADSSSALVPFPELEKSAPMCPKKAKAAAAAAAAAKAKPAVMKLGASYVLGKREAAKPVAHDVEQVIPKTLSRAQVATVVQAQMGDVQFCWNAIPKAQRVDACTLQLRLSIAEGGAVSDVEVVGPVSAPTQKCIAAAVAGWSFPTAETSTEIEYGISLRSL